MWFLMGVEKGEVVLVHNKFRGRGDKRIYQMP